MSKENKKPEKIKAKNFEQWVKTRAEETGKTEEQIVEEVFHDGWLTWIVEESGGTAAIDVSQMFAKSDRQTTNDIDECIRLRQQFAPIAACIDYLRDQLLGDGVAVMIDDPTDNFKKELKEYLEQFVFNIYQDDLTRTLDVLISIMVDIALTTGVAAAEICYEKQFTFWDYAKIAERKETVSTKDGNREIIVFETKKPNWTKLGGITRLKIFSDAFKRFKLYRDPTSWEASYWSLDETQSKDVLTEQGLRLHYVLKNKAKKAPTVYFHPWQLFWLVLKRENWSEIGVSVIKQVLSSAKLLEKIMKAIGEGIHRAGNKKYFIVCGTEKRPWSTPHTRNLIKLLQEASKKNWSTIPVPQGFDVKEIGGEVFEGNSVVEYFLKVIARGMNVPAKVVGVDIRNEPNYSYKLMRRNLKVAIQHQLFKRHVWCKYGKTKKKQGGSEAPIYIPEVRFKTEDLLSPQEKLKMLVDMLNVANPLRPLVKLEVEREMCRLLGWDEVLLPTQEEYKKQLDEEREMALKAMKEKGKKKKEKAEGEEGETEKPPVGEKYQGKPKPQTEERQKKRLQGMLEKHPQKGKAKPMGAKDRVPQEEKPPSKKVKRGKKT